MKALFLTLFLVAVVALAVRAQNPNAFPVHTSVAGGTIEGDYDNKTGIQTYLGIPFAQPPVGELRWQAPQPVLPWNGIKETKTFGPRAVQRFMWPDMLFRSDGVSEDCLYLNVWTPAKYGESGLPVLVYFYGGGHVAGDGSEYRYDGESMAKEGIVVVTINYRLNIFGYFAHPELSAEAPYEASGNYGALDQAAALKWVHNYIESFGGDPKRVTIAGESAGSMSTSLQMASPLSRDYIAGAIGESGALINPTGTPVPLAKAEKNGLDLVEKSGYSFAQFRHLPTSALFEIFNEKRPSLPIVIDGYLLPKTLPEIFAAREQAQVPLLLGWNSGELPAAAFARPPFTREAFDASISQRFPDHATKLAELYGGEEGKALEQAISDFGSDNWIVFSTWKWFDLHRNNSEQSVYRYLYSKLRPANDQGEVPPLIGAPHACEIEYAMGNLHLVKGWQWTEEDHKVSETMKGYFANFIKTGNPNTSNLPQWSAAKAKEDSPPVMIINVESKEMPAANDARYRLLNQIYHKK